MDCCSTVTGDSKLKLPVFYVGVLLLLLQVAAAQHGFISIDCGSTENYTDERGIAWATDDGYITTGTNAAVTVPPSLIDNREQLSTARRFPSGGRRYCYIFPGLAFNGTYLIRASFLYGDLASPLPAGYSFNVAIDSNIVGRVDVAANKENNLVTAEYFVATTSYEIAFCLLPYIGDPFISSLELRTLKPSMYDGYLFLSQYGVLIQRLNCGANVTAPAIRYPDDPYDRIWETPTSSYSIDSISATPNSVFVDDAYDDPPLAVMQDAWADPWFWFTIDFPVNQKYYVAFYFYEFRSLNATDVNVIDTLLNGNDWSSNITLYADDRQLELYRDDETAAASTMNFTFTSAEGSTKWPILNGFEIHAKYTANTSTTATFDRQVLDDLRRSLNLMAWRGDPCFPVPWHWLTCSLDVTAMVTQINLSRYQLRGTIPTSIGGLAGLTDLWLDNNFIAGSIPNLGGLTKLQTLHLQNNSLTGPIPDSLADVPLLTELFLQDNDFNGTVPTALLNKNGLNLKLDESNTPGATPPAPGPQSKSGSSVSIGPIIGAVAGVAAVILILAVLFYCLRKRRKSKTTQQSTRIANQKGGSVQSTKAFSLAEVYKITNKLEKMIGEGGFGPVYFGKLDDGTEVAVKVNSEKSGQGWTEFSTEVSLLSRIHHRNLVHLIGFCDEGNNKILIYEFIKGGTLREHLYGRGQIDELDWPTRVQIVIDAARGLEYLHYDCHPRIIHRDVKSNNILLNENSQAKVTDFGLSKSHEEDTTGNFSTSVKGTTGYLDPEYYNTNRLTYKSDVYAFGVVLLEMISGRAPINTKLANERQWALADYARQMLSENRLEMVADRSLGENYNKDAMWKIAELAMRCVEPRSVNRPEMREVVKELVEASQYGRGIEPATGSYVWTSEFDESDTTQLFKQKFFPSRPKPETSFRPSHHKPTPATANMAQSRSNSSQADEGTGPWDSPDPR